MYSADCVLPHLWGMAHRSISDTHFLLTPENLYVLLLLTTVYSQENLSQQAYIQPCRCDMPEVFVFPKTEFPQRSSFVLQIHRCNYLDMKSSDFIVHNVKHGGTKLQVINTNAINSELIDDMVLLWKAANSSS